MDITVVLTNADKGRMLNPSVRSIEAAIKVIESKLKVELEWFVAVSSPSPKTKEYLESYLPAQVKTLIHGDENSASVTNQAVQEGSGKFVAVVDGNDLISSKWLYLAYQACMVRSADVVYHPGMIIEYGDKSSVFIVPDQEQPDFSVDILFTRNQWTRTSFALRKVFLAFPFIEPDCEQGFGQADWHWACETVVGKVVHKPVRDTFACCRVQRMPSCIAQNANNATLMPASSLFDVAGKRMGKN